VTQETAQLVQTARTGLGEKQLVGAIVLGDAKPDEHAVATLRGNEIHAS
jgi:hypothetical protein